MNTPIEPAGNEESPSQDKAAAAPPSSPHVADVAPGVGTDTQKSGNVFTKGLLVCGNCGTELLGETCYLCGQPTKGLVRQFSSILGDFLDTVLNIDTRVFRTIGPLIYKPGFLTQEYFSGRRIRYVSPVRLFFFLAVLTFLLAQFSLPEKIGSEDGNDVVKFNTGESNKFSKAKTVAEVESVRAEALKQLSEAQKEVKAVPIAAAGLEQAKKEVKQLADKRIAELSKQRPTENTEILNKSAPPGVAISSPPDKQQSPALPSEENMDMQDGPNFTFNGEAWDEKKNPIKLTWLPESVNAWLNGLAKRAENNGKRINKEPKVIIEAVLSSLPMTLFLMLPVFALMLKVLFIFKRRLYMEHLIVALHSHAFLMLAIMLLIAFNDLSALLGSSSWLIPPINMLNALLWMWMPIYLFLMQKRVYQQGWIMTFIKYAIIGNLYIILLSMALACTLIVKMIWL